MISDTLSRAVSEIDGYLTDPVLTGAYSGKQRNRLIRLRGQMDEMRKELDTPRMAAVPAVMYAIIDTHTKQVVKQNYRTSATARRIAHTLDSIYGAVRYTVIRQQ